MSIFPLSKNNSLIANNTACRNIMRMVAGIYREWFREYQENGCRTIKRMEIATGIARFLVCFDQK